MTDPNNRNAVANIKHKNLKKPKFLKGTKPPIVIGKFYAFREKLLLAFLEYRLEFFDEVGSALKQIADLVKA